MATNGQTRGARTGRPGLFSDTNWGLVRRVTEALNEAGLAPNHLMLEVTEHAVIALPPDFRIWKACLKGLQGAKGYPL